MAVKLADTLAPMADFPAVMAKNTNIVKEDGSEKSLQKMYDDNELGGSGLPTPESKDKLLVSTENEETSELEWSQVDKSTVGDSPFIGTEEEWEELSLEEKAKYKIVNFLDDGSSGSVDKYSTDEVKTNKVWIDGKPIYRKTMSFSTISTDFQNPSVIATNVAELVNAHGSVVFVSWGNTTRTSIPLALATAAAGGYVTTVIYNGTLGLFYSVAGASWVFKDAVITVEYTKTN